MPTALTPPAVLRRLCDRYEVDNLNALARELPRHLGWDAKKLYRWEKVGSEDDGDGPNFWHTIEMLELAGMLTSEAAPARAPLRVRDLAAQLEAAAEAIDQARATLRGSRGAPPRVDAG